MFVAVAGFIITLGALFTMYTYQDVTGIGIFSARDIANNTQVVNTPSSLGRFLVPDSYSDVDEFFNVDPGLAVRAKAADRNGQFDIQAYSSYVKSVRDLNSTIDILMYVKVEKTTRTFSTSIPIIEDWQRASRIFGGTHFVKSAKYGGYALGYYRMKAYKGWHITDIKTAVKKYFGRGGELSDLTPDIFRNFRSEVDGKYYALDSGFGKTSLENMSMDLSLEGIWRQATEFKLFLEGSDEKGTPVAMELADLNTLDSNFTEFKKDPALSQVLSDANKKFDDLRVAYKRYYETRFDSMYETFTKEQKNKFQNKWEDMQKPYFDLMTAVNNLDITGCANQLDEALAVYGKGTDNNKYNREYDEVMADILSETPKVEMTQSASDKNIFRKGSIQIEPLRPCGYSIKMLQ